MFMPVHTFMFEIEVMMKLDGHVTIWCDCINRKLNRK